MLRRRAYYLVVLVLVIAVVAIRDSRRSLWLALCPPRSATGPLGVAFGVPALDNLIQRVRDSDVRLDTEWETWIARGSAGGPSAIEYGERAVKAGQDRPETYASAIMAYLSKYGYTRRETAEMEGYRKPKPGQWRRLDPGAGKRLLDLSTEGAGLDPDNAFFDLVAAYTLLGLNRDAEALDAFRSAASKEHFRSYRRETALIASKYNQVAGLPSMEAYTIGTYSIMFPHAGRFRSVGRMVVWHAGELEKRGRSAQAEELLSDVLAVGRVIQKDSPSGIERLTASSMQSLIGSIEPAPRRQKAYTGNEGWEQAMRATEQRVSATLRKHGWHSLAADWEREWREASRFRRKVSSFYGSPSNSHMLVLSGIMSANLVSGAIIRLAGALLLVTGMLSLVLWMMRRRRVGVPGLSNSGKTVVALLALVPWLIAIGADAFRQSDLISASAAIGESVPAAAMWDDLPAVLVLGLIGALAWAIVWQVGHLPRPRNKRRGFRLTLLVLTMVALAASLAQLFFIRIVPGSGVDSGTPAGIFCANAVGLLPLALFVISLWATIRLVTRMPAPGQRWRLAGIVGLTLSSIVLAVMSLTTVVLVWTAFALVVSGYLMLALVLVVFGLGRTALLSRSGACPSTAKCLLQTMRESSVVLAKVLVMMLLVLLLVQLPFRAWATVQLQAVADNEVRAIMRWAE